jgi:hypothetical protein
VPNDPKIFLCSNNKIPVYSLDHHWVNWICRRRILLRKPVTPHIIIKFLVFWRSQIFVTLATVNYYYYYYYYCGRNTDFSVSLMLCTICKTPWNVCRRPQQKELDSLSLSLSLSLQTSPETFQ